MFWRFALLGKISSHSLEEDIASGSCTYFDLRGRWKWLGINPREDGTSEGFVGFLNVWKPFKGHTNLQRVGVILKQHRSTEQEQYQLLPRGVCGEWHVCVWSLAAPSLPLGVRCCGLQLPQRFRSVGMEQTWGRSTIHSPVHKKKWEMSELLQTVGHGTDLRDGI